MPETRDGKPDVFEQFSENVGPLGKEIGFGVVAGYTSGLAMRFAGRIAAVGIGGAFVFLQSLAYSGYVQVDWAKIEHEYHNLLDLDGDGKVTSQDASLALEKIKSVLLFNMPAGAGFTGGLYYGMGGSAAAAGKLGMAAGLGTVLARGVAVTGAPAILSAAAEYGDVREYLDEGRNFVQTNIGLGDWIVPAVTRVVSRSPPPETLQSFQEAIQSLDLDALRSLEKDLPQRLSQNGYSVEDVTKKLDILKERKHILKLQSKKTGWFL
eukprot:CAMPEP_0196592504 /NCGR_PEP_ID=MMETSP1081-20130531/72925_1 /TAXON_ID=36882 /ORGANISM="Pyramimonas amylifera, Strain CCMP720" /LENGTH=265 /DNA_ID=CAMNT_0041916219 /DNA_START=129 /DNA_END=926 /DNA_ORIENTATION=+